MAEYGCTIKQNEGPGCSFPVAPSHSSPIFLRRRTGQGRRWTRRKNERYRNQDRLFSWFRTHRSELVELPGLAAQWRTVADELGIARDVARNLHNCGGRMGGPARGRSLSRNCKPPAVNRSGMT